MTIATAGGTHYGIAIDGQDNVYYSDNLGGTIWEIPATSSTVNNDKVTVSESPTSLSGSGTFTVSGSVVAASGSVSNTAVVITVKNPSGTVVATGQATVAGSGSSGAYTTTFVAGGTSSWLGGTYSITATYGTILGGTPASASSSFSVLDQHDRYVHSHGLSFSISNYCGRLHWGTDKLHKHILAIDFRVRVCRGS